MSDLYPRVDRLKPMGSDVLLVHVPRNKESTIIHIEENPQNEDVQMFRIGAIGSRVTSVKVGETILVSWTKVTPEQKALDTDGEVVKIGFSDEKELLAVIDEE